MSSYHPCRVILVGMMGSGKTTVGRALATATGWAYVDNDELVRRATGSTSRALLAARGPEEMRRAELAALRLGLDLPEPAIVAAAGGTIADDEARRWLRDAGMVVWLRANAAALASRAPRGAHRPWLEGDAAGWLRQTSEERAPLYESVADLIVDTDAGAPRDTVAAITAALRDDGRCLDRLTPSPG